MAPGSIPTNATEIYQEGIAHAAAQAASTRGTINRHAVRHAAAATSACPRCSSATSMRRSRPARRRPASRRAGRRPWRRTCSARCFGELLDRSEAMTRDGAARACPTARTATSISSTTTASSSTGAGPHRGRGRRSRTAQCTATSPAPSAAGARAVQLRAVGHAGRSLLRGARAHRGATSRRMAAASGPVTLAPAGGHARQPAEPAPVNARTATIKRITGMIVGALRDAIPERVPADVRRADR